QADRVERGGELELAGRGMERARAAMASAWSRGGTLMVRFGAAVGPRVEAPGHREDDDHVACRSGGELGQQRVGDPVLPGVLVDGRGERRVGPDEGARERRVARWTMEGR